MVAISAANSATLSLQSVLNGARVAQARREADQAEANVQNLRQQADQAENEARQSQVRWRDLSQRSQRADPIASRNDRASWAAALVKSST